VNGGASTYLGLKDLHAQEKGGRTEPRVGQAGRPGPTGLGPSWPDSVAPSLPWVLMSLCTLAPPFALFSRCHPRVQDGGSPCMKTGLLRFNPRGCSFVTLRSLTPLGMISSSSQTRTGLRNCSFELVVTPSFMSMFSCKNITFPNAHTKPNLLYHECALWPISSIIKSKPKFNEHVWCTKIHCKHWRLERADPQAAISIILCVPKSSHLPSSYPQVSSSAISPRSPPSVLSLN
jgi:hypothetical protein